ncbi:MAG: diaminopimelate epimerase [Flavobacteriaceae bacterium]|nr:diaminopimelate epimerase [Flavobacteriaceae bacterium]|tara:strand:- start:45870 stop:46643 length:774 start_codon:yes stop_codon:yes gene_type:complete
MKLTFSKYQGTGNDFVMIDNRTKTFPKGNPDIISRLCDRNFGIGADGVILIENADEEDFRMEYFNPDATETFCGNGGRCAVAFAKRLGMIENETKFLAFDGLHFAQLNNDIISLQMIDVDTVDLHDSYSYLYTGTPHHVQMTTDLGNFPVFEEGRKLRYELYGEKGSNINFVEQKSDNTFRVRTYEKGVENETLACGTGVTAVAIAMHASQKTKATTIHLPVEGGKLSVSFQYEQGTYSNVFLSGPAEFVFGGNIAL